MPRLRAIFTEALNDPNGSEKYRLLCHNCNMARGLYGYCPHEGDVAGVSTEINMEKVAA